MLLEGDVGRVRMLCTPEKKHTHSDYQIIPTKQRGRRSPDLEDSYLPNNASVH